MLVRVYSGIITYWARGKVSFKLYGECDSRRGLPEGVRGHQINQEI